MARAFLSAPTSLRAAADALARRFEGLPGNIRGAAWITVSALAFTLMATTIKALGPALGNFEIAFFRSLFGLCLTLPFCLRGGISRLATKRVRLHLGRAAAGVAAMLCGYYGYIHLPLADATAISFTKTLFMIFLAVLFLGEAVHRRRWTATAVGFVGVLIMLRPGGEGPVFATLVALAGAAAVSVGIVFVKKLTETERPVTILLYYGVLSTLATLPLALATWTAPTSQQLVLMALVAVLAVFGQFCAIRGYRSGEATALVPFGYARLVFAAVVGFVLFQEIPDLWSLAGATVIALSTLYIALREARWGKRPPSPEPGAEPQS